MRGIAQTLAEVGAPDALLLQLTNPLNVFTACIDHIPGIRVYGFCHGYHDTEHIIARSLGLIPLHAAYNSEWRQNAPTVRVELAGNNHFVFADKLQIGERIYAQSEIRKLTPQIFDGPFREAVWSRYGVYVGNCARHPIEFLPGFNDRKNDFGRLWGVAPVAGGFRWRRTTSSNCASAADARESAVLPSRSTSTSWAAGHFSATRSRPEAPLLPRWKAERSVG
jgi:alpha-galactosidase/6-phospho-beta-glucosidase family protein